MKYPRYFIGRHSQGLLCSFLIGLLAFAEVSAHSRQFDEPWRLRHFTKASGLPSNAVNVIAEDSSGVAWVGTDEGLAWFDGFEWIVIDSLKGLPQGGIREIVLGDSNRLFVLLEDRLYVGSKERFTPTPVRGVVSIVPMGNDRFMISTDSVFEIYDHARRSLRTLSASELPPMAAADQLWGGRNSIWLPFAGGLSRWTGDHWVEMIAPDSTRCRLAAVVDDGKGRTLLSISYPLKWRGLWEFREPGPMRLVDGERNYLFRWITVAPDGGIVAINHYGEFVHRENDQWRLLNFLQSKVGTARFVCFRKNGDLWIGTMQGLFLYDNRSSRWNRLTSSSSPDGRNSINELLPTRSGDLWVATGHGMQVLRADGSNTVIDKILDEELNIVTGLGEDDSGNIWISSGSDFSGAYRWDGRRWTWCNVGNEPRSSRIHKIRKDRRGRLWFLGVGATDPRAFGTQEPGAFVLDHGAFQRWGVSEGLVNGRVYAFDEGPDSSFWFGTWGGISRWKNGQWRHWTRRSGLKHERVFALAIDGMKRTWFADRASGLGWIGEDDSLHYYSTEDGLANNNVWSLVPDSAGALWIGTNGGGVSCLRHGRFSTYDTESGLPTNYVWPVLPYGGKVYIGTSGSGVVVLDPAKCLEIPPRIAISRPSIQGPSVLLRWRTFAFDGELSPEDVLTRFRIDDDPWSSWSTLHEVNLDEAGAGSHSYEIQAKNLYGYYEEKPTKGAFVIPFPLYQQPSFLMPVCALLFLALLLLFDRVRRKRLHDSALTKSEAKFRRLTEATFEGVIIHDHGIIEDLNQSAVALLGGDANSLVGQSFLHFVPKEEQLLVRRVLDSDFDAPVEVRILRDDGHCLSAELVGRSMPSERSRAGVLAIRDITERRKAADLLLEYQEQLRSLASELSNTEERERQRMASYLHDAIGQALAICNIKLGVLQEQASTEELQVSIARIREMLKQTIQDTRSLTMELSPPVLHELTFAAAVEWLTEKMQEEHAVAFAFQDDGLPKNVPEELRHVLFSAVRELMLNVVKHAHATRAKVSLAREQGSIAITVEDNGLGFDTARLKFHKNGNTGFGLFSIRERLKFLAGSIEIASSSGRGTRVVLRAPLAVETGNSKEHTQ